MHPVTPTLLLCVLSVYPLMQLYKRVGLSPFYALLIFASLVVPFSGFMLVAFPLATKPWPNFPKAAPKPKPIKLEIT
ncbi:MAG: hypothetical protein K2Q32_01435 [Alphaproteobacteria bacterium]|nr:hypothetical protein [Alphaproteobacteria bacterium]